MPNPFDFIHEIRAMNDQLTDRLDMIIDRLDTLIETDTLIEVEKRRVLGLYGDGK